MRCAMRCDAMREVSNSRAVSTSRSAMGAVETNKMKIIPTRRVVDVVVVARVSSSRAYRQPSADGFDAGVSERAPRMVDETV